jgi:hypothetical protein
MTIKRSILLNGEIRKTAGIKDSVENSPQVRKREDLSDDRMMQKSGVKFTAQQDMIWKSENFSGSQKDATTSTTSATRAPARQSSLGKFR